MTGASATGFNGWGTSQVSRQVQPYLYPTEDQLVQTISKMMLGPSDPTITGLKTAGADQINRGFATLPQTMTSKLSGLGFGKSGKLGTALYNIEGSRLGDLSQNNSSYDQLGLGEQNTGSSLAEALLAMTTGSYTSTGSGGTQVGSSFRV